MRAHLTTRLLAATLAAAGATGAGAQTIVPVAGVPFNASALTSFATVGADMGGMLVTAYFTDGTSANGVWGDLGGGTWGVLTPQFSLTLDGGADTFGALWQFQIDPDGVGARRLVVNGAPGKTVFDLSQPSPGSVGSASGWGMEISGGDPYTTTAFYTNAVGVAGAMPVGDLFETLDAWFDAPDGARFFQFRADTDNIARGGTITQTPEPATYGMLAFGMAALFAAQRRRRTA